MRRSSRSLLRRWSLRLRSMLRLRRLYWLRTEIRLAPTETQRLFALTMVIGVVCGLAAVAFHLTIAFAERHLIDRAMAAPGAAWIPWTILTPLLGALACGAALHYFVPGARGSGVPQVKTAFALRNRRLHFRDAIGKFALGALQIGSGSSLGREGPTVQICAGIAAALGRLARISPKSQRRLLPVGAAAGIAAAFNAPIAAVTFTIEEVVGDLDRSVLSGLIIAAALAAVIERSVLGEHPVFEVSEPPGLRHASSLLIYALLGVAAALVSIAFSDGLLRLRKSLRALKRIPEWARPGIGGLVTGGLAVVALQWFKSRGVTGGGYDALAAALSGGVALQVMLWLGAMKFVATIFSYSSGGAGGIFAPALFIGGMLGGVFGNLDVRLLGHEHAVVGAFALVGMGAVFAGVIRAPMTSVLIIIEMTGGYSLILPLMIANMIAYGLARRLRPTPIYEALLEQDGIQIHERVVMDVLESMHVERVFTREAAPVLIQARTRARDFLQATGAQEVYPVVDPTGRMVGIITRGELQHLRSEGSLAVLANATDVMQPPVSVGVRDDVRTALELMIANGIGQLPVVDEKGRVVGHVDEAAIAKAYLRGQSHRRP